MFWNLFGSRRPQSERRATYRPSCEALEDRQTPSTVRTLVYNQITPFMTPLRADPVLSRDGSQIVYHTQTSDNRYHVLETNANGSGQPRELESVSNDVAAITELTLDVSADGSRITYVQNLHGTGPGIRVLDAGGPRDLLRVDDGIIASRLTADGTKVIFLMMGDARIVSTGALLPRGLYVLDLVNGGGPRQLVTKEQVAGLPQVMQNDLNRVFYVFGGVSRLLDVSDDGSRIIFGIMTDETQKPMLFGVNGDGTGLHSLSQVGLTSITNFGISGDGNTVFDVIADQQGWHTSVSDFNGNNRREVDQLPIGINEQRQRFQLSRDGSRLLVNGFARLVNTDGSGVVDLRPSLGSISNLEAVTMNSAGNRFAYYAEGNNAGALTVIDLNPVSPGAAPVVVEPQVTPAFNVTSGPIPTVTSQVSAVTPIEGVRGTILLNGVDDRQGGIGMADNGGDPDAMAGDGIFTGRIGQRPNDVGRLLFRLSAATTTTDGLNHVTVLDADPTILPPQVQFSAATYLVPEAATGPTGLVSWWRAEGSASDSADGNNGTLFNGAATAPGRVGQAFRFEGVNDYFEAPDNSNLQFSTGLTASAWINFNVDPGTRDAMGVFAKGQDVDGPLDWALTVTGTEVPILGPGRLRAHVRVGGDWVVLDGNTVLDQNRWYHAAMSYDGTTLRVFVNGVLDGSRAVGGAIETTGGSLRLGTYAPVNGGQNKHFFSGLLDEARVYNRALGADEILASTTAGAAVITVTRNGDTSGTNTVTVHTGNGTATPGSDYAVVATQVSFAANETSKTILVPIFDDAQVEGNETINLTLSNPTAPARLGSPQTAILTIQDNDVAPPPSTPVQSPAAPRAPQPLSAALMPLASGKGKAKVRKLILFVQLQDGRLRQLVSPFQKPSYSNIGVSLTDTDDDGVLDSVLFTGRKGRRNFSVLVPV